MIAIFIAGILVGWLTKVPFLLHIYKKLKQTADYREAVLEKFLNDLHESKAPDNGDDNKGV